MKNNWLFVITCMLVTAFQGAVIAAPGRANLTCTIVQEEDTQEGDESAQEEENPVDALAAKFEKEQMEFWEKIQNADEEEREELFENPPSAEAYSEEILKLAKENPKTEIAESAYTWMVSNIRDEEIVAEAFDQLFANFIDSEKLSSVCMELVYSAPSKKVEERLDTLIEKSPHDSVKATASYAKASYLEQIKEAKGMLDDPGMAEFVGEEGMEYLKNAKVDKSEIEKLYQSIVDNYADEEIVYGPGQSENLGEMAASALFAIKNLSIGCVAPDIVGQDLDGKDFKLSDYRGKVVMLDFWGDW